MELDQKLEAFFQKRAPLSEADRVLVAFSGGADSCALLAAMCAYGRRHEVGIAAAHVDHRLDPESEMRAEAARRTASKLGMELVVRRRNVGSERRHSESLEMAARRIRYLELGRVADSIGARYLATAHHREDQAETVLMRIAAGHGLSALSAVPQRRGAIVRPLLEVGREELLEYARRAGLTWAEDVTNRSLEIPRNRIRHLVMPALRAREPSITSRLANLAGAAGGANTRLARELEGRLEPVLEDSAVSVRRQALADLPAALVPFAIVHLLRICASRRRPSKPALDHVAALLAGTAPLGVDLGGDWRLEDDRQGRVRVLKTPVSTPHFAYNLSVPGEIRLAELAVTLRLQASFEQPWMFQGDRFRAGLVLPILPRQRLIVRNRRPGDRIQPLGSRSQRKLKDLLIDHGVPRRERDRIPLLCHSDRILWVPGITIDHEARIRNEAEVWLAEIICDE